MILGRKELGQVKLVDRKLAEPASFVFPYMIQYVIVIVDTLPSLVVLAFSLLLEPSSLELIFGSLDG